MRLAHVAATDLHRRFSLDYAIDPVTVFVGPNGAGKSTALGVLSLVLNGRSGSNWPVLGESPDYDWSAQLTFDRRTQVARYRQGDKSGATLGGIGGTEKAMAEKIAGTIGRAATWSIESFLALTPQKRLQFLEAEILDGLGWDCERAWEALGEAGATRESLEEVLTGGVVDPPDGDARVLLSSVLGGLSDVGQRADADARRLGAACAQDDKESESEGLPPGTAASWRARVAELDEEIKAKREERGVMIGSAGTRAAIEATIAELDGQLLALDATDWVQAFADLDAKVDGKRTHIDDLDRRFGENQAELARATETYGRRKAELASAAQEDAVAQSRLDDAKNLRRSIEQSAEAYALLRRIATKADRCPICGEDTNNADLTLRHIDACELDALVHRADRVMHGESIEDGVEEAQRTRVERDACKVAEEAAGRVIEQIRFSGKALVSSRAVTVEDLRRAEEAALAARQRHKHAGTERVAIGERRAMALDELGALTESSTMALDVLLEGLTAERAQAQRSADAHTDAAERTAVRIARRQALATAQAARSRARELHKLVTDCMETMLAELVAPFEEPIDRIVSSVLGVGFRATTSGGLSFWLQRGASSESAAIMRNAGEGRVPFDTASRSERAVVMMALRAAIQSKLGGWRHLVLDDMENLEADRRGRFVAAMIREVEGGRLDNFVGACVDDGWRPAPPVRLHLLDRS